MKKLGYGKHYSYNPDFAHPVYNVRPHIIKVKADEQEYLPTELSGRSSLSDTPDLHFLKTPEAEAKEKKWDDERLREWEGEVKGNQKWEGRPQRS